MKNMRTKFEMWILSQFGKDKRNLLEMKDSVYVDSDINMMWISFNAGSESVSW